MRRIRTNRLPFVIVCYTLVFAYYYGDGASLDSVTRGTRGTTTEKLIESEESDEWPGVSGEVEEKLEDPDYILPEDLSIPQNIIPDISDIAADEELEEKWEKIITKYAKGEVPGVNCTPPGIDDFPDDLFTQKQRQRGWVLIHFLVSLYIFVGLAVVCDEYFVPSMERICEELNLPSDVAGATFMAIATSAPELFTNIIGTFITKGDIGVGTIVGSAVFNILAVAAVCGLGAGMVVPLEWWSVTRDCFCYLMTVCLLLIVLRDERIYWYEALVLVLVYLLYILVMYKNAYLKKRAERLVGKTMKRRMSKRETTYVPNNDVKLENKGGPMIEESNNKDDDDDDDDEAEVGPPFKRTEAEKATENTAATSSLCTLPSDKTFKSLFLHFITLPARAVFSVSVPDCRTEAWRAWYPLTFAMCIVWIGTLSYVVNWMMTIIGHTCRIPDSVMGLTFIAAGTSVPEVVSSLIVARQGLGTMAVSNSIGSNTFDVLICLGLPWLIRATTLIGDTHEDYIQINSTGLEYSTMMLITSLAVLYAILAFNKFKLDRMVGTLSLLLYFSFLVFASLFEMNVFFRVNLPTCQYHED